MKVVLQKLGRSRAHGITYSDEPDTIYLDPRITGKKHLEILLHEALHLVQPVLTEDEVIQVSVALAKLLWAQDYRRIDNRDDIPMQDGS
jgi:hypothetical protein